MARLAHRSCLIGCAALALCSGCRWLLGPDDARPPDAADAAFDGLAIDDAFDSGDGPGAADIPAAPGGDTGGTGVPTRLDCNLLLQDCASRRGCYPDEEFLGNTLCLARGAGGPLSPCVAQDDCDARLACISPMGGDPAARVCVELCHAGVDNSGCQPGLLCAPFPAYPGVGYCRY